MKTKLGIPLDMAALLAIIRPTCANSAITIPAYAAAPFIPILPQQPTRPLGLHQSPLCLILPKTQPTLHLGISIQTQSQRSEIPSLIHPRHSKISSTSYYLWTSKIYLFQNTNFSFVATVVFKIVFKNWF